MSRRYAKLGKGTTFSRAGNLIAEIVGIKPPSMTGETKDVTTMDSSGYFREFIGGLRDGGEASLILKFYPGDADGQYGLYEDYVNNEIQTFVITLPDSIATFTFPGNVTGYNADVPLDDAMGLEVKIKICGQPSLGVTASTGWSAFALRDSTDSADATALSVSPAVSGSETKYIATFTTNTEVLPKVTAASHTIMVYVDSSLLEELTSGSVGSETISFSAGESKEIVIIAWEENKQPYAYKVMTVRTS